MAWISRLWCETGPLKSDEIVMQDWKIRAKGLVVDGVLCPTTSVLFTTSTDNHFVALSTFSQGIDFGDKVTLGAASALADFRERRSPRTPQRRGTCV